MKSSIFVPLVLSFLLITSVGYAQSRQNQLRTGAYGYSLLIAVNSKEQNVTGRFGSSGGYLTSEGWDCNFYFSGKMQTDETANIVAVSIGSNGKNVSTASNGMIIYDKQTDSVVVKLFEEVSGCARGEDFMEEEPAPRQFKELSVSLEPQEIKKRRDDVEYRIISERRSYLYDTPLSKHHKKAYLTCGDIVIVTAKDKVTDRVYARNKKNIVGWLSQKDLLGIGDKLGCR